MKLFHLNKVNGWKNILVLIHKNETDLKMILRHFFKLLVNLTAFGKFLENVRNRLELELIRKDDVIKIIKQQSKLTFNGILKSCENCDSYTFKQNHVVMDKAIYVLGSLFLN